MLKSPEKEQKAKEGKHIDAVIIAIPNFMRADVVGNQNISDALGSYVSHSRKRVDAGKRQRTGPADRLDSDRAGIRPDDRRWAVRITLPWGSTPLSQRLVRAESTGKKKSIFIYL